MNLKFGDFAEDFREVKAIAPHSAVPQPCPLAVLTEILVF